jgi:hypothetical protein
MNWGEFKDTVRTFLLVDAMRKGRGMQNYINQLTRAALIDLQRYVPELLVTTIETYRSAEGITNWDVTKQYAFGDLVSRKNVGVNTKYGSPVYQAIRAQADASVLVPPVMQDPVTSIYWTKVNALSATAEGAQEGSFDKRFTLIRKAYIRQFPLSPTNTLTKSRYHAVRQLDWSDRYKILDGKTPQRTITFGDDGFVYAPSLGLDEKLLIEWEGENHFSSSEYFSSPYDVTIANSALDTWDPPYGSVGTIGTERIIECLPLAQDIPAETLLTFKSEAQFITGSLGPAGPLNGKGDEALTGRVSYLPAGVQLSAGDTTIGTHDAEEVVFDEREAKAVAEYVKAHLQREVDKDLNMYQSHWKQYQKERQEIYRERREHKPSNLTDPYPVAGATVGPQQIN